MRASTAVGRIAAIVALGIAAVLVGMLFLGGDDSHEVTAEFQSASQLVKGSEVVVGGRAVGTVKTIELGPQGQALVTFSVADDYWPLYRGTTATVRAYSLSGIANRQVQLTLPPQGQEGAPLADGDTLSQSETVSEVDLDQLFNTLDPATVRDFKHVIQGFETSYSGVGEQANRGYRYLNPFLSTSRRLFGELTSDTPAFERLIVDTSKLSGALAARQGDISALTTNAARSLGAIGDQRAELTAAVNQLPAFMRQANTTFLHLRQTLDVLDPLVDASKPVADRLGPFFKVFRAAAADAVPTISDLNQIVAEPGKQNDLVELTKAAVPLAKAGVGSGPVDCGANPSADYAAAADGDFTQGALSEAHCALRNGLPTLAFFRAYQPALAGWFNDFGPGSGIYDANGGISRIALTLNQFSLSTPGFPSILQPPIDFLDSPLLSTGNTKRCPGGNERPAPDGSNPFTENGTLNCDPADLPPGP